MINRRVTLTINLIAFVAAAGVSAVAARAEQIAVPAELWDRPRTGQMVLAVPAIRQALSALVATPEAKLTVRHPPGVEPALQAEELRAWLVAHAIEPARIGLRADLQPREPLALEIGR